MQCSSAAATYRLQNNHKAESTSTNKQAANNKLSSGCCWRVSGAYVSDPAVLSVCSRLCPDTERVSTCCQHTPCSARLPTHSTHLKIMSRLWNKTDLHAAETRGREKIELKKKKKNRWIYWQLWRHVGPGDWMPMWMLHLRLNFVTLTGSSVSRDAHNHLTLTQLQQLSKLTYYFNHNRPFLPHAGHTSFVGTETWCKGLWLRDWTGWVIRASWLSRCLLETKTCFRLESEHTHHRKPESVQWPRELNSLQLEKTHGKTQMHPLLLFPAHPSRFPLPAATSLSLGLYFLFIAVLAATVPAAAAVRGRGHEQLIPWGGAQVECCVYTLLCPLKHLWRVVSFCRVFVYTCRGLRALIGIVRDDDAAIDTNANNIHFSSVLWWDSWEFNNHTEFNLGKL